MNNHNLLQYTNALRKKVAEYALKYIKDDCIIGVGTGNTISFFIEALKNSTCRIKGAVPSSKQTEVKLRAAKIPVLSTNDGPISIYIDSADECNSQRQLIKGGGGALTREKIVAACSEKFLCIIDQKKYVSLLRFPVAIEVIPMARSYVAREVVKLGGDPVYRSDFITDNGNQILDVHYLDLSDPAMMEAKLNNITGVVCNGLFAIKPADLVLISEEDKIINLGK